MEGLRFVGMVSAVVITLFALMIAGATWAESASCHDRADLMDLDSNFGFWTGCMVKTEDGWRPLNYYRVNE